MFTKIGDLTIEFLQKGKGKDILLLHGWGGNLESLSALQSELSKRNRVTNISLPGFGKSKAPERPWSLRDYALFLEEIVLKLKLKRPTLVGHSFGGKISLKFALEFPELISEIILLSPSGIKPKNSLKKTIFGTGAKIFGFLTSVLPGKIRVKVRKGFYKYAVRETDYLKAGSLSETFKKIVDEHLDDNLKYISIPTRIFWAEKDTYVPLWMGKRMHSLIPNSRFEIVENETHGFPIKNPKLVARLILN